MQVYKTGIDLGGTKTEVAVLDAGGDIVYRKRVPTHRGAYAATLDTIRELLEGAERELDFEASSVGIAIPGSVSGVTGRIKNANSTWLNGKNLSRDLSQALQGRPVYLENDANCFALSEAVDGAGQGYRVVWGLILGTGSGSGIVIDGKTQEGRHGLGGEWGHNSLPWQTEEDKAMISKMQCYCGFSDCVELFVSGTGFERAYAFLASGEVRPSLKGPQIMELCSGGDLTAVAAFEAYLSRLARAIAATVNVLDPDVIVLGGGMSNVDELYSRLPEAIVPYIFGHEFSTPIVKARYGDSSGVRGAAWLNP